MLPVRRRVNRWWWQPERSAVRRSVVSCTGRSSCAEELLKCLRHETGRTIIKQVPHDAERRKKEGFRKDVPVTHRWRKHTSAHACPYPELSGPAPESSGCHAVSLGVDVDSAGQQPRLEVGEHLVGVIEGVVRLPILRNRSHGAARIRAHDSRLGHGRARQ